MTTVIDPGTGSEAAFFNKSGTAILNQSSSGPTNSISVSPVAGRTILNATDSSPGGPVQATVNLSASFQIGDEFLFRPIGAGASSWQVIDDGGNSLPTNGAAPILFIKLSDTVGASNNWAAIVSH